MTDNSQPRKVLKSNATPSQRSVRTDDLRKQLEGDFSDEYEYADGDEEALYEGAKQQQEYHQKQLSQRGSANGLSPPTMGSKQGQDAVPSDSKQQLGQKINDFNKFVQQNQPDAASFDEEEYEKDEFI